tara:strand:+ start:1898 stop:2479 length:582 start_codon:yes stop_codon:yes gene_type:complete
MDTKYRRKIYKNCDLSGKRFGRLVVSSKHGFKGQHRYWECKCDCGNEVNVLATNLKRKYTKSCGCLAVDEGWLLRGEKSRHWKGYKKISGHYWNSIKDGSARRNIKFLLSIEEAWEKFEDQKGFCALTGCLLTFGDRFQDERTASLDRIDNMKGYVMDNIQWLHKDINKMKNCHTQEHFCYLCSLVSNHSKCQ